MTEASLYFNWFPGPVREVEFEVPALIEGLDIANFDGATDFVSKAGAR